MLTKVIVHLVVAVTFQFIASAIVINFIVIIHLVSKSYRLERHNLF